MTTPREERLLRAFVRAADTLVADYDPLDLLQQLTEDCVDILAVNTAGLLLGDHRGELQLAAATSDETRLLELFQLQIDEGPCLDTFTSGAPTLVPDLAASVTVWPTFVPEATAAGFGAIHALPLRLRSQVIGVLGLFNRTPGDLDTADVATAQALVDVATIGVLHQRVTVSAETLNEQLQSALNTRVAVEQAKGVLAERSNLTMDEAFGLLRTYSRAHRTSLRSTCHGVIDGTITIPDLTRPQR